MQKKISVVVPIYKVQNYLIQCIDSILNQTLKDIEVILVDEGDIDECRAIIDMYEFGPKKDERVKTIHEKNGGYGASVNKGLEIATGEYISIIESDDFIAPEMYEELYNYAKKLDADIVKTPYYEYWDKTKDFNEEIKPCFWESWVKDIKENELFSIKDFPVLMGIHPSVWSCIYKREYLNKFNIRFLSDRGAYVDHHFKAESLLNTDKIAWLNKAYYYYRLSNENASAASVNVSMMIKRWNQFHKLMEKKYPNRYSEFAEYNFREEYINTVGRVLFYNYRLTEEDIKLLRENLNATTEEQILNAKNIKKSKLKRVIELKNKPELLNKYIRKNGVENKNIISFLGLPILKLQKNYKTTRISISDFLPLFRVRDNKVYLFGFILIAELRKS